MLSDDGRRIVAARELSFIRPTEEERPMRICRKCSKRVSDDSKICRDCGAILEDIPDDVAPVATEQPEPSVESGLPFTAESQAGEPSTGKGQSVGEVRADSEEPPLPDRRASAWNCPRCGETVPGTFDLCWKCQTTKDGEKTEDSEPEFFEEDLDASKPDEQLEPTDLDAEPLGLEDDEGQSPSACPQCGSSKMMLGVTVCDQGQGSRGTLTVVICGDPSALIFKDRLYGELRANICGDCGHVELRVTNPRELYRHYRKA